MKIAVIGASVPDSGYLRAKVAQEKIITGSAKYFGTVLEERSLVTPD